MGLGTLLSWDKTMVLLAGRVNGTGYQQTATLHMVRNEKDSNSINDRPEKETISIFIAWSFSLEVMAYIS